MKKLFLIALNLLALINLINSEEFQCKNEAGCTARITENGEVQEVSFRKNDIVSTEAGWVVSPDDGWEKIKTKDRAPNIPPSPSTIGLNLGYTVRIIDFPGQRVILIQPIISGLNDTGVISKAPPAPTTIIIFQAP